MKRRAFITLLAARRRRGRSWRADRRVGCNELIFWIVIDITEIAARKL